MTSVNEQDYFSKAIGPITRAMLTFDAGGNSRGVATIIFKKAGLANEAQAKLDGVKVDDRAMKVRILRFTMETLQHNNPGSDRGRSGPKEACP